MWCHNWQVLGTMEWYLEHGHWKPVEEQEYMMPGQIGWKVSFHWIERVFLSLVGEQGAAAMIKGWACQEERNKAQARPLAQAQLLFTWGKVFCCLTNWVFLLQSASLGNNANQLDLLICFLGAHCVGKNRWGLWCFMDFTQVCCRSSPLWRLTPFQFSDIYWVSWEKNMGSVSLPSIAVVILTKHRIFVPVEPRELASTAILRQGYIWPKFSLIFHFLPLFSQQTFENWI